MTTNETKCGKGEISIDGVTTNIDFTVDIRANPINKTIPDRALWRPPIFSGCIHSMPARVFEILKTSSYKFHIRGEVQNGTTITCDNCRAVHIEDSYEKRGACISCNISFDIGDLKRDFYLEYAAISAVNIE